MRSGEIWELEDGSRRLVLSPVVYNASALGRVITAVLLTTPQPGFDPFAVPVAGFGVVCADRIAMHPRHWLVTLVGRVEAVTLATVRDHLKFLVVGPVR